jgi:hypothetical protein
VRFTHLNRYKLTGGHRGTHRFEHSGVSSSSPHASILYPVLLRVQKRVRSSEGRWLVASTRSWWQWLKRLSTQGRHGPLEREHAPENGPKLSKIVIGMPLKASGEARTGIEYGVSCSRCADNPPRGGARNGIGEESRLRPQSFTKRRPAIYKKLIQ